MIQAFQQLNGINNLSNFRKWVSKNDLTKILPQEITQAVLDKDLPLENLKEIIELNDNALNKKVIEVIERKKKYEKNIITTAKLAVKKKKLMKEKMNNLAKVVDKGVILSSIWNIGKRDNCAGDSNFYGNAPTQVVEQCILRLTCENDLVLDPMAGSGTTLDVCKYLKRKCIGYDLNPQREDIIKNDSHSLALSDNSVDFIFFHPPYWNMVKYSKDKKDFSTGTLNDFLNSIDIFFSEAKRVLKNGKYISILAGDLVENGKFVPLTRKIANIAESNGFEDCGQAIKITSNSVSQIRRGKVIYAELANTNNLKVNHDHVLFFKKN